MAPCYTWLNGWYNILCVLQEHLLRLIPGLHEDIKQISDTTTKPVCVASGCLACWAVLMDWLADMICNNICSHSTVMQLMVRLPYTATTNDHTPCRTNEWQISFQTPSFGSVAPVCQRCLEVTWKNSADPLAAPLLRRRVPDASRLQQQRAALYQSAPASIPASATCPTLSVSEHISWAGQKPAARFSYWLTEGFLHGSLRTRIAGCLRSHYRERSGGCVVFGGLFDTSDWVLGIFNYILSSGIM